jgi:molecular chaperone GrpE
VHKLITGITSHIEALLGGDTKMTEEEFKDAPADTAGPEDPTAEMTEEVQAADETAAEASGIEDSVEALAEKLEEAKSSLAEAEEKVAEYLDGWQRAQAAFANFRKRTEAEQAHWRGTANAQLLTRLLPVLDDFRRAFETVPESYNDDPWLDGIRLVQRKVKAILDSESVTPIELECGDAFDPNIHQAVLYQEVEGFDEGEVVAEIETGYTMGDRVLRPSLVVVAKGSEKPTPTSDEEPMQDGVEADAAVEQD